MLESCRKSLEQDFVFGALLTDFSKAFDSLSQEMKNEFLLAAKLIVYVVEILSVRLIYDYL